MNNCPTSYSYGKISMKNDGNGVIIRTPQEIEAEIAELRERIAELEEMKVSSRIINSGETSI